MRIIQGTSLLSFAAAATGPTQDVAATCRGLLFVQLYGVYEYAVGTSVQAALDFIRTNGLSANNLRNSVLSLVLHPDWESVGMVGRDKVWDKRHKLLDRSIDTTPLSGLNVDLFPSDGSHYRNGQIETIWTVFGISLPIVPDRRLLGRIDELVENRNAIAHGRLTARDVGRNHSTRDMQRRIEDTREIAIYIIRTIENHCSSGQLTV